jgi:cytochrome c-type biogenesis protein CcmH
MTEASGVAAVIKVVSNMKNIVLIFIFCSLFFPGPGAWAGFTANEIARELMSPACPGKLLIDCTSGEAGQVRELIRQKIQQGQNKEDIIKYFVEVYGEQVLASPPKKGFYLTAWILPLLVIIYSGLIVYLIIRVWLRKTPHLSEFRPAKATDSNTDDVFKQRLEEELKEF